MSGNKNKVESWYLNHSHSKYYGTLWCFTVLDKSPTFLKLREVRDQRSNLIVNTQGMVTRAHPKSPIHSRDHNICCMDSHRRVAHMANETKIRVGHWGDVGWLGKLTKAKQTKFSSLNTFLKITNPAMFFNLTESFWGQPLVKASMSKLLKSYKHGISKKGLLQRYLRTRSFPLVTWSSGKVRDQERLCQLSRITKCPWWSSDICALGPHHSNYPRAAFPWPWVHIFQTPMWLLRNRKEFLWSTAVNFPLSSRV